MLGSRPGTSAGSGTDDPIHMIEAFVFNDAISDTPLPSFSPRDRLAYRRDKGNMLDSEKYANDHPELARLMIHIQSEVLKNKPDDIIEFLCDSIFTKDSIKNMKANFRK